MGARMIRIVVGVAAVLGLVAGASTVSAQDKDTLVIALDTLGAQVMDPIADTRAPHAHYHAPIWDSLVGFDLEKGGIGPGVAERWTRADDGKSWTFYLRKGLKFHNGDPVTAPRREVQPRADHDARVDLVGRGRAPPRRGQDRRRWTTYTVRVTTKGVIPHFAASLSRAVFMEGTRDAEEVHRDGRRQGVPRQADRQRPVEVRPERPRRSHRVRSGDHAALARHPAVQEDDAAPRARAEHPHRDGPHGRGGHREHRPRSDQGSAGGRHEDRERAGHDAGRLPVLGPLPSRGEGLAAHRRARARGALARRRPAADHRPRHGASRRAGRCRSRRTATRSTSTSRAGRPGRRRRCATIRRAPSSSSPRPATPTASR